MVKDIDILLRQAVYLYRKKEEIINNIFSKNRKK